MNDIDNKIRALFSKNVSQREMSRILGVRQNEIGKVLSKLGLTSIVLMNNSNQTICQGCGESFLAKRTAIGKFCSSQCQQDARFRETFNSWLNDVMPNNISDRLTKRCVIARDGYYCSLCGIGEWQGRPIGLELEHKDGDGNNHHQNNVCLLCPNCHSQTETFKGKNKGRGRKKRRERYLPSKNNSEKL